jgi:hypothetical protein
MALVRSFAWSVMLSLLAVVYGAAMFMGSVGH